MSALAACAAPQTQLGSVSQDQIVIEQARQQQFALEQSLKQEVRVQNVANPLLRAGTSLCGQNVRPLNGFMFANAYRWRGDFFAAARAAGFGDTIVVTGVAPGSAADRAGLHVGDRILQVNGSAVLPGNGAIDDLNRRLPAPKSAVTSAFALTYQRGDDTTTVLVRPDLACAYSVQVSESDDVNAISDGQTIFINTGILRFVADDDELAVVIGHELGHNAMHHIDAQKKNTLLGGLMGAIVDVAAASQGVNTHGDFTNQGMQLGSLVFSQDFEREADYVGLYILALAGKPIDDAPNFWRRMAAANPKSIKFASTHPTTAERFVRLSAWRGEIERKMASGQVLAPEMKRGSSAPTSFGAPMEVRASLGSTSTGSTTANIDLADAKVAGQERKIPAPQETIAVTPKAAQEGSKPQKAVAESVTERGASATIGAPSSELARSSAIEKFQEANRYIGSHQWSRAEAAYREALLLDGSQAPYHAALARVLMTLKRFDEAEAEYTAAVLLDIDNPTYRKLVKDARAHH